MNQKLNVSYDDVLLKPQYSDIMSRSEIDISVALSDSVKLTASHCIAHGHDFRKQNGNCHE